MLRDLGSFRLRFYILSNDLESLTGSFQSSPVLIRLLWAARQVILRRGSELLPQDDELL